LRFGALMIVLITIGLLAGPTSQPAEAHSAFGPAGSTEPTVLDGSIADTVVRIRGGAVCSGTPITGTNLVVTAAHCVLDADGEVAAGRTVVRDGVEYEATSVLVDRAYHATPNPNLDAAILVMDQVIPGASATLANTLLEAGSVTLVGFQPLDTDGTLLRGTNPHDRAHPQGSSGGVVEISTAPAGCVGEAAQLQVAPTEVRMQCGLIPGASGGGLFATVDGAPVLIGIISTVSSDLTMNGLVPLTAVHELLDHAELYTHEMPVSVRTGSVVTAARS
jgi:hypothetical protein